jgi:tetratricopeptide (TPR) repeat protein
VAEIFVSYTAEDRGWADWIGLELERLGHKARLFDWEVSAGGNVVKWMEEHHNDADHVLSVVSSRYLDKSKRYSEWERQGGELATASGCENFLLPIFVEPCQAPTLLAVFKRCDLHGLNEAEARARLAEYLKPAAKPSGRVPFPGARRAVGGMAPVASPSFPGSSRALSNVPITVPRFFLGRDEVMRDIRTALVNDRDRVAITTLFGLRGVGKTTLAAAYASHHRGDYLATWWIRAESDSTIRADLTGLGVRLGWVVRDEKEEGALGIVMDRLREDGAGILLVFDNAIDADSIEPYLPTSGDAHVLVTSNAHAWRDIATPLQIDTWPREVGADYLISRTGRKAEREAALALSDALGGLPLAHEQAAAYCERLEVPFATYHRRFDEAPVTILDDKRDAPRAFHSRLTAFKAFGVAIDEAMKLNAAAESLILYAALLAPEPIPLYFFSEGREKFSEPFASLIADGGLDEAIAALRTFALIDRESIPDEREVETATDCIRLHRLVRQIAISRIAPDTRAKLRGELVCAMALGYPGDLTDNPAVWPKIRRLDAIALALADEGAPQHELEQFWLLAHLAAYRDSILAAYAAARPLLERALVFAEKTSEAGDEGLVAKVSNNLGALLYRQGDFAKARNCFERTLAIEENMFGLNHPELSQVLSNLGGLSRTVGNLEEARSYYERALAICEGASEPAEKKIAAILGNLASLFFDLDDITQARSYQERALDISERQWGADHPQTAAALNNLASILREQGDIDAADSCHGRALAIREKVLGPEHPDTAESLNNLGFLKLAQRDFATARQLYDRALMIREKVFGPDHPKTALSVSNLGYLHAKQGDDVEARPYYERALSVRERVLGQHHPETATSLCNLGHLMERNGELPEALTCFERALAIREEKLGRTHPDTRNSAAFNADLLDKLDRVEEADAVRQKYGINREG